MAENENTTLQKLVNSRTFGNVVIIFVGLMISWSIWTTTSIFRIDGQLERTIDLRKEIITQLRCDISEIKMELKEIKSEIRKYNGGRK